MIVWKFPVPPQGGPGFFKIEMPKGAIPRKVAIHDGQVNLWMEVDKKAQKVQVEFYAGWTGYDMPNGQTLKFIDTIAIGELVWHFYHKIHDCADHGEIVKVDDKEVLKCGECGFQEPMKEGK